MNEEPLMIEMTSTKNTVIDDGISCTLTARMGTGGNQVNAILDEARNVFGDTTTTTMVASAFKGPGNTQDGITIVEPRSYQETTGALLASGYNKLGTQEAANDMFVVEKTFSMQAIGEYKESDAASSLKMRDYKDATDLIAAVDCRNGTENPTTNGTLQAKENGGTSINYQNTCRVGSIVRRLTPLECERLQGYPDGWTDIGEWADTQGKKHKEADSPRYKALGNSIALPFWHWMLGRMSEVLKRENPYHAPTLGSLFDGIGGFPICWEDHNGKGTARWASEIEEFPIAVTKLRFPEPEKEDLPIWLT